MFGKKRKQEKQEKLDRLTDAMSAGTKLADSDELDAVKDGLSNLREAWSAAGFPSVGAGALIQKLEERVDLIKRRPHEQALRPCGNCKGRAFRISDERSLEYWGNLRLIVCEGCRLAQVFWMDSFGAMFSPTIRVPDDSGPFR